MYKKHMELIELDKVVGNLSRALQCRIQESAKEIYQSTSSNKTVVQVDGKMYLVRKIDYRTIRLTEVDVVEES